MDDLVKYDAARNWISLTLPEDISKDEWLAVGMALIRIDHCTRWNVGEWLRLGNRKWGEMYDEAVKLGFSYQSARDAVWLAGEFPLSRRRDKLTWSHHRNVASLDQTDADRLLDDAIKNGWSEKELRRQVSALKAAAKPKKSKKHKPLFDLDETDSEVISPETPPTPQETQSKNITPPKGPEPGSTSVPNRSTEPPEPDIDSLHHQLKEKSFRIDELENERERLGKEKADLSTKYNAYEAMAIGLRADFTRSQAAEEILRDKLKEAEQKLSEAHEIINRQGSKLFIMEKDLDDVDNIKRKWGRDREKIVFLENQLADCNAAGQEFLEESKLARCENDKLQSEIERLKRSVST
jgi:hypothetical protein